MQCCGVHCIELVQERVERCVKNWFRIVPAGVNYIELAHNNFMRFALHGTGSVQGRALPLLDSHNFRLTRYGRR